MDKKWVPGRCCETRGTAAAGAVGSNVLYVLARSSEGGRYEVEHEPHCRQSGDSNQLLANTAT